MSQRRRRRLCVRGYPSSTPSTPLHMISVFHVGIWADQQLQPGLLKKAATKNLCISPKVLYWWWNWLLGDISQERLFWKRSSVFSTAPCYSTCYSTSQKDFPEVLEVDLIPSLTSSSRPSFSVSRLKTVSMVDK